MQIKLLLPKMLSGCIACLCLAGAGVQAQEQTATGVPGVLYTRDRRMDGRIRWLPVSREYQITARTGVSMNFRPEQVTQLDVRRPEAYAAAVEAVRRNQLDAAIETLDRIAQEYLRLEWDVPATRWLAEAYLRKGDAASALRVAERLTGDRAELAHASELAPVYWRALLQAGRLDRLTPLLDRAIAEGTPERAARAFVVRGDLLRGRGEFREALKAGYLRVIMLLESEREVMPEALFRAMQCFEQLGQVNYAQRMRQALIDDFPSSEFGRRVQGGA